MTPTARTSGAAADFILTVTGTNFCTDAGSGSFIVFDGEFYTTTTPTTTSASATIPASSVPLEGTVQVSLVTNEGNCPGGGSLQSNALTFTINPGLVISPQTLPNGAAGSPYNHSLTVSGGTPPYAAPTVIGDPAPPNSTSAGTVTFNFTSPTEVFYSFQVTATDSGGGQTTQEYFLFLPLPDSLFAVQGTPQSTTVGTPFPTRLQVVVTRQLRLAESEAAIAAAGQAPIGSPVQGALVTFTAPGAGPSGAFSGSNSVFTDGEGVATAPPFVANAIAGGYTVVATVAGTSLSVPFSLTNLAGSASNVIATAGTPQSATVNTAYATALQARVRDAFGNGVSGVSVTFAAPAAGASGAFGGSTTVVTNAGGFATAPGFTANTVAGSFNVTATAAGVATPAGFSLTNTPGPAAAISATAGTPQNARIFNVFPTAMQATVRDSFANPISGASVTFTAPATGASGAFSGPATVSTNASGVATAPAFTANSTVGTYSVTASTPGVATPASFSLTNDPGVPASVTPSGGTPQTASIGSSFTLPLRATVRDAGGNPLPNVSVTFTLPAAGSGAGALFLTQPNFTTTAVATTNAAGVATSPPLSANGVEGVYNATATVSGVASPAIFNLVNAAGPTILTETLPVAQVGVPYQFTVQASGGSQPYTFAVIAGPLPAGLTMSPSGTISGTPTAPAVASLTIEVTDNAPVKAAKVLLLRVVAPLSITTSSALPNAYLGLNYFVIFQATGGQQPYTWAVTAGSPGAAAASKARSAVTAGLPPGLTFNPANGTLSGSPTALGDYSFGVEVTDAAGNKSAKTFALTSAPASSAPAIQISQADLNFQGPAGGNAPAPQYLSVVATNQQPLDATVTIDSGTDGSPAPPWLTARFDSATTPARLAISTNQAGLAPGTYTGRVLVKYQGAQTLIVNVTLVVNTDPPQITVSPQYLRFAAIAGSSGLLEQALLVTNAGTGGPINFTASVVAGNSWLSVTPANGATIVNAGVPLRVIVNPSGLAARPYWGKIRIASPVGGAVEVPVSLYASPNGPILSVNPRGVQLASREGNGLAAKREIALLNIGSGVVNWTAELQTGQGWLQVSPASGASTPSVPGKLTVSATPQSLAAGPYYGLIRITDPQALNSPQYALAVLNVRPANAIPEADLAPAGLYFVAVAGGAQPASQNLQVYVSSDQPTPFQAAASSDDGGKWLTVGAPNGVASTQSPGQIAVSVNTAGLPAGVYTGDVSVSFSTPGIRTANITLVLLPQGATLAAPSDKLRSATGCAPNRLALNSTTLANAFSSPAGWPTPISVRVTDDCGTAAANAQVIATFSNGDPPLALSLTDPSLALYSGTWAPGVPAGQTTVTLFGIAQGLATTTARLVGSVGANQAPTLDPNGIVNNLNPGAAGAALAPGTIAQVYGGSLTRTTQQPSSVPLPTSVDNTSVLIGFRPAPLYFVSSDQINVQIPTELEPDREYSVLVSSGAAFTLPESILLSRVSPGLLEFAQHADFTPVTPQSPVVPGESLTLYLVGMGLTDVPVSSGAPAPNNPLANVNSAPTVTIGAAQAQVTFAGLAPGSVGLYQINLTVPENLPSGDLPVTVTQLETASNTFTLPVR